MTIAAVGVPIAFLVLKNSVGGLPDLFQAGPVLALFIAFVVIAMGLMGCSTSISVSIEGKSFYYKKSLPIKFEVQMLAKILINMLLSIPSLIFMLTTFPIMIYLNFYISDILLLVLLIISTGVLVSTMGLFINLMFIKLDWINEMVVVKQSMSVFLAVLVSLLLVIGSIFLIDKAITIMSISLSLVLINAIYLLLSGLFWHLIVTIGKKKYNKQV
jgi:ABC-2 type transport system permease protein